MAGKQPSLPRTAGQLDIGQPENNVSVQGNPLTAGDTLQSAELRFETV